MKPSESTESRGPVDENQPNKVRSVIRLVLTHQTDTQHLTRLPHCRAVASSTCSLSCPLVARLATYLTGSNSASSRCSLGEPESSIFARLLWWAITLSIAAFSPIPR